MSNESTAVAIPTATHADTMPAGFGSAAGFALLFRAGKMLASTELVPESYRDKPADCALIVEIAQRINASPLMVANNLDIIHGRPSWRAQFLIASVNRCGRFSALRYEWRGTEGADDYGCRAWARELASGDRLDGIWIDWKMVKAEGWSKKSGSKWLTMAPQMFVYRAAAFWTRAYAPDIALGFPTSDEVRDIIDVTPLDDGTRAAPVDRAKDAVRAALESTAAPTTTPPGTPYEKAADALCRAVGDDAAWKAARELVLTFAEGSEDRTKLDALANELMASEVQ